MRTQFKVKWYGKEVLSSLERTLPAVLKDRGEEVLKQANKTAPIRSGDMIRYSYVAKGGRNQVWIVYAAPYAHRQHETLWYKHRPGRRAKWLELTIREMKAAYKSALAWALAAEWKRLGRTPSARFIKKEWRQARRVGRKYVKRPLRLVVRRRVTRPIARELGLSKARPRKFIIRRRRRR